MKKLLYKYRNGNYDVFIFDDGTKIRRNNEDELIAAFPESIDMKISNRCDMGCPQCHEKSVPNGALANLNHPLLDSLHPGTELALGGGNVLEHPELEYFLRRMAAKHIICNMTLHFYHFLANYEYIKYLSDEGLIHGIGISINTTITDDTIEKIKSIPNTVIHTIAGIIPWEGYMKLANHNLKLLILGYKTYGRGIKYWQDNNDSIATEIVHLTKNLPYLFQHFSVVSFDNLALEQLDVKSMVDEKTWEQSYMGDDGKYTMYVDLVEERFATSSVSPRMPIHVNNIDELFKEV